VAMGSARALERYAWIGGVLYVVALITESVISLGFKISQDDSAAKIANSLDDHHKRLILVFCLCILYIVGFVIYLTRLDDLLRRASTDRRFFASWVLIGGVLFVTLHGVSDVGIYALLAGKVAAYSAQHEPGLSYTLYLLTFALDSVGDVFASFFMLGTGLLVLATRVLPRWLGWIAVATSPFFFLQGFGLGGVIANFGLVLDLVGFLLFLIFVLASSMIGLARAPATVPAS
jgi:nucleoside recognition membrane protein YjiH